MTDTIKYFVRNRLPDIIRKFHGQEFSALYGCTDLK